MDRKGATVKASRKHIRTSGLRPERWFFWKPIPSQEGVSDCNQSDGKLHLYPDGTGLFECITWTDHTIGGDTWRGGFILKNASGKELFTCKEADSPLMSLGNKYPWTWTFSYPAEIYDAVQNVYQFYCC